MSENEYGDFARFYDVLQKSSDTDYEKIGAYYSEMLRSNGAGNGILLDLACGTGALSRYFAKEGYDVIGTDASPDMLGKAWEKDSEEGLVHSSQIQYLMQDMTELDLFGTIDACVCALDGINHLAEPDEVKKAFGKVALFMNPNGVFVFDVNTVNKHANILAGNTFVYDLEGFFCVWRNFRDESEPDTIDVELDFFEMNADGLYKRSTDGFSERAFRLDEISQMLTDSGFEIIGCYDWLTFDEGGEDCEKVVFATRKIN